MHVAPKDKDWLRRRLRVKEWDDVYAYLEPLLSWMMSGASLFTDWERWATLQSRHGFGPTRGRVTICGFRRPEVLGRFKRATVMSALFKFTYLYAIWEQLGVTFVPSTLVELEEPTTPLGSRKLRIYWVTDQGWSKRLRDRSGGIVAIFQLILKAGIIDRSEPVCVCINKDDGGEDEPSLIYQYFGRQAVPMPDNSRGQNRFRDYHQLIHTAALNSHTDDINWIENVLGIDGKMQRLARTGQEIYQTLMRLSIRKQRSDRDITVAVMDKDVAEWLQQWFMPADHVEINEIDSSGVVKRKRRTGRPALGDRAMTNAERQRLWRERRRGA